MHWFVLYLLLVTTYIIIVIIATDIDECQSGEYQCDVNAECVNIVGNYSCKCISPYVGDGFTCSRKYLPTEKTVVETAALINIG